MVAAVVRKGANAPLLLDDVAVDAVRLTASWQEQDALEVDLSVVLLGSDGRARSDADFVFFNQPDAEEGAVRLLGRAEGADRAEERVMVSLADLPDAVSSVVAVLSLDEADGPGLGSLAELALTVSAPDEQPLVHFPVGDAATETALVLGELYRRAGAWRFRAVGQGYDSGLAGVARDYGITVDSAEPVDEPVALGPDVQDALPEVVSAPAEEVALPVPPEVLETTAAPAAARKRAAGVRTRREARPASPVRVLRLGEESWHAARLFPVAAIGGPDEQERRATSALLAVLMGVREYGRALTGRLGAPAGALECYLEVPFALRDGEVRPDGLLVLERAGRRWTALVEVKTGTNPLERAQVESYLDVARDRGFDAVVTVSNELPAVRGEHPVGVDKRKLRKVSLHHIAWAEVLHEATMLLQSGRVADPTQAWVLHELTRYLQHPRSGASGFVDMGAAWVPVRDAVRAGTLRPADRKTADVGLAWERLVRSVSLHRSADLGVDVSVVGARRGGQDAATRASRHVASLNTSGSLQAALRFPGTVGDMALRADLKTAVLTVSVELAAPAEGRPTTRVNWLLRQLTEAPEDLKVEVLAGRAAADARCEVLRDVRKDVRCVLPEVKEVTTFRLSLDRPLGLKRSEGRGGFITSVDDGVEVFYRGVLQGLKAWVPAAPKLPAHDASDDEDQPEATDTPAV